MASGCRKGWQILKLRFLGFFLLLIGLLIFNQAQAIEYGGIGGKPAYPRADNPRTESIFIHSLNPGEVVEDGVLLVNNTNEVKILLVYAVDSVVATGGNFACRQRGDAQEGVGKWILLQEEEVVLGAGANKIIPFIISAPVTASAGEQNGCIVIQEKKNTEAGQTGMSLSFRTGLRVAITIPGELTRHLEIGDLTVKKTGRAVSYHPAVRNVGNVSVDANVKINTRHFLGLENVEHGGQYPVLRGETSDWNFEIKNFYWGGFYKAAMTVEYEGGDNVEIGKSTGQNAIVLSGPKIWYFVMPALSAFLIEFSVLILLVFLIILAVLWQRRRRWVKDDWIFYSIKTGENIKGLAARLDVSWKLLAKANKLAAPYILKVGDKIKVPPKK